MPAAPFKDRYAGLIVFGILELMIGVGWLLGTGTVIAIAKHSPAPHSASAIVTVAGLAVLSFGLGIGTLLPRRWARVLSLLAAWGWLVFGLLTSLLMNVVSSPASGPAVIGSLALALFAGLFVFFYSRPNVKATFEARDPLIRWTDKCPAPVLLMSLWYGISAATLFVVIYNGTPVAVFGSVWTGMAAQIHHVAYLAIYAYLAWGMYTLSRRAWWIAVALTVLIAVSSFVSFFVLDRSAIYQAAGISAEQVAALHGSGIERMMQIMSLLSFLWLGYLAYIKKYFAAVPPQAPGLVSEA